MDHLNWNEERNCINCNKPCEEGQAYCSCPIGILFQQLAESCRSNKSVIKALTDQNKLLSDKLNRQNDNFNRQISALKEENVQREKELRRAHKRIDDLNTEQKTLLREMAELRIRSSNPPNPPRFRF